MKALVKDAQFEELCVIKYLNGKKQDGSLTPQMLVRLILEDTAWFMRGLSKKEHGEFVRIVKVENTGLLTSKARSEPTPRSSGSCSDSP